MYIVSFCITSI